MTDRAPTVAIFGAGIAGLTAAHELAERGFSVTVYERGSASAVGGLAASQRHVSTRLHDPRTGAPLVLPGEHGFRVFMSFYRHVDDTMRRIPGADASRHSSWDQEPSAPVPSVLGNLVPTNKTSIAMHDAKPVTYDRRRPKSLEGMLAIPLAMTLGLGYEPRDCCHYVLKVMQFLTSCAERRAGEYEKQSFWDFLQVDKLGERQRRHLAGSQRVLLGMDLKRADAKTQGEMLIRVMLDQASDGARTDRVLNGPTTERWLKPWQQHLEAIGVRFAFGHALKRFEIAAGAVSGAVVQRSSEGDPAEPESRVLADYFVSALPIEALAQVIAASPGLEQADDVQADAVGGQASGRLRDIRYMDSSADHRAWVSGLQFYLSEDTSFLPGHVQLVDSEWALSLVSQRQFWSADFQARYGGGRVRGILSIDICDFEQPGRLIARPARGCTDDEIAIEVWSQLSRGLRRWQIPQPIKAASELPPPYLDHHLDTNLICEPERGEVVANSTPYFITPPGSWTRRPGPLPDASESEKGYRVRLGKLVLVGSFTQTHTGLTTMESANESARHGVNGILDHLEHEPHFAGRHTRCQIWPLEQDEPGDLAAWKYLDQRLYRAGRPHVVELLGIDRLISAVPGLGGSGLSSFVPEGFVAHSLAILRAKLESFAKFDPF